MDVHASCRQEVKDTEDFVFWMATEANKFKALVIELKADRQRLDNQAGTCCDED